MAVKRNDPCPCGSGKKYKKCCLKKDRNRRIEQKREQLEKDSEYLKKAIAKAQQLEKESEFGAYLQYRDEAVATIGDWSEPENMMMGWLHAFYATTDYQKAKNMVFELLEKQPKEAMMLHEQEGTMFRDLPMLEGFTEKSYVDELERLETEFPDFYALETLYFAATIFYHYYGIGEREKALVYLKQIANHIDEAPKLYVDVIEYLSAAGDAEAAEIGIMTGFTQLKYHFAGIYEVVSLYNFIKTNKLYRAENREAVILNILEELKPYGAIIPEKMLTVEFWERAATELDGPHDLSLKEGKKSINYLSSYYEKVMAAFGQYLQELEVCPSILGDHCRIKVELYFEQLLKLPDLRKGEVFQITEATLNRIGHTIGVRNLYRIKWEQVNVVHTGLYHFAAFLEKEGIWDAPKREATQHLISEFHRNIWQEEEIDSQEKYKPFQKFPLF